MITVAGMKSYDIGSQSDSESIRFESVLHLIELKNQIKRVCKKSADLDQLRRAINSFRPRVRALIKNNAGPIKAYHS